MPWYVLPLAEQPSTVQLSPTTKPNDEQLEARRRSNSPLLPLTAFTPYAPQVSTTPLRIAKFLTGFNTLIPLSEPATPRRVNPFKSKVTSLVFITMPSEPAIPVRFPARY